MNIDIFNDTVANINKELNEAIEAAKKSERNYVSGLEVQDILWRNLGICPARNELYWALYGWDCDSVLLMNPDCIEVEE